jgi:hypothetical protein
VNTPESDLERAAKNNPAWMKLRALPGMDPEVFREAYNEAWEAGHRAGEMAGYRQAAIEGGDEGCRFGTYLT